MEIPYEQINGFSYEGLGGNPAGLVTTLGLTTEIKHAIAAKLGFPETVFIGETDKADLHLEYFTPTEEVNICGHATIASLGHLNKQNHFLNQKSITIKTRAGIQKVFFRDGRVYMTQSTPKFAENFEPQLIANILEIDPKFILERPQIASTGLRDCLVKISSLGQLKALAPNLEAMTDFSRIHNLVGFHIFTTETLNPKHTAFSRNFAPACGIDEESATGTSNLALASWLENQGHPSESMVFEQGDFMNAASRIYVQKINKKLCVGGQHRFVKKGLITV